MKKIYLFCAYFTLLSTFQFFAQSKEIKTIYTMNENRSGGNENMTFKVGSSYVIKKDEYYGTSENFPVKLKSRGYNDANEFLETYHTPIDIDNISKTPVSSFNVFSIFYSEKGGQILGIMHVNQRGRKMYFTKYGYNKPSDDWTEIDIIEKTCSIKSVVEFSEWIESQPAIIFKKRTNNKKGYTKLYEFNEQHLIVAFNYDNQPTKIILVGSIIEKIKVQRLLTKRGLTSKKDDDIYCFFDLNSKIYYVLKFINNNLILDVVNEVENM